MGFLDHTPLDTYIQPVGPLWTSDQPVIEDVIYTTHNKHNRQTSMPSAGFEPATPEIDRPQTYALDRATTGFALKFIALITIIN